MSRVGTDVKVIACPSCFGCVFIFKLCVFTLTCKSKLISARDVILFFSDLKFNFVGHICGDNRHFAASLKNKRLRDAFSEIRIFSTGSKRQTLTVICSGLSAHFG